MKKSLSDFTKKKNDDTTEKEGLQSRDERVGVTLRLGRRDWERLHYLSIQERTRIQKLLLEGINKVLESRGLEKMQD